MLPPSPIITKTYLDVDYDYEASAGEMGASTTAGNAGQLMGISGAIDSQTESAAFTYDNVGRLVTSSQTTNGASAERRFAYDRYGNRTGVWNAVTGGTQIQSVTLGQSGGATTNRIASVTENSATVNYVYDAAGNVTDDGVNTFVYDAENRLVSVNSGAEQYKYDHQNRRIEKIVGSVGTHYVWEGSQALAEHAASTGNVLVDYVFAGGRMTKKVEGATTRYFLSDRLSVRLVLSPAAPITGEVTVEGKQSHLPFGEAMAVSGEQDKHRFTSYERDTSTGLDYAVNRWHSSGVGRFLQVDPIAGNIANPQRLNRYSYTKNNPINKVDPLGLDGVCGDGWRWDDYNSECVPDLGDIDGGTTYAGDDEVDRWDDLPDGGLGGDWDPAATEGDRYWTGDPNEEPSPTVPQYRRPGKEECSKALAELGSKVSRFAGTLADAVRHGGLDAEHHKKLGQLKDGISNSLKEVKSKCFDKNGKPRFPELTGTGDAPYWITTAGEIEGKPVPPVGWKGPDLQTWKIGAALGAIGGAFSRAGRAVWEFVFGH